ncbi:hypothetical protein NEUTE1DRAFT_71437 [Neurospora tetrasperma FGSC 2508]|uniref:SPRY domain-containing protein n=1 Tax=Neurospora tetrasperma (strain FGSC 2508 / ATCC MYA-4615 / P0657) TaxID=510951 RepID=F8N0K3_NEUT8|nr:uncharacterized protein NEUTE1DRAFT_71437 [Neurospora tetrasperma FGSC 2508]EGO52143.1 hypothetical protein NEUTE1DRAFT_71437 [Neurospora tetrasperma FGSC 2508]
MSIQKSSQLNPPERVKDRSTSTSPAPAAYSNFSGVKDKTDDTPGPRPAQHQQSPQASGKVNMPSPAQSHYQQQPQWQQQQQQQQQQPAHGGSSQNDYAPPSGPPPNFGHSQQHSSTDYAPPSGPPPSWGHNQSSTNDDFAPPAGPPPSHARPNQSNHDFAPPPGPPPSQRQHHYDDYAPPPGPPPSHHRPPMNDDYTQPPPGPPPSQFQPAAANKQHDWESFVPDTALFPPPPAFFTGYDRSHTTNATEEEANAGEAWCVQNPLTAPMDLDPVALDALRTHNIRLMASPQFRGKLDWVSPGVWKGKTEKAAGDACIISYPPLYCVKYDSPLIPSVAAQRTTKSIYYEVSIPSRSAAAASNNPFLGGGGGGGGGNDDEITLALGFTALPYPAFRMPGWHRGSLAVHGDDGHKYVNDRWGGKDFTRPFRRGETYGIGMTFTNTGGRLDVNVFFTREGRITEQWDLHEEGDAEQDLPVTGLEGFHDLSCAIGTYSAVEFEAVFEPSRWKFRPQGL